MKIKNSIILLAVLALGVPAMPFAQEHRGEGRRNESQGPRDLHLRLKRAHEGIERGVKFGSLTREESHRLTRELDSVRDDEARMRADGRLTRRETERLEKELNRLERHIAQLKNNENRKKH